MLQNPAQMRNLIYILAVILLIIWAVAFLAYGAHEIIHALPVIAIIIILIRLFQKK